MIADLRIERLLNAFSQTLTDLPKRRARRWTERTAIIQTSRAYSGIDQGEGVEDMDEIVALVDYAAHLTDVIDRMEWALDKAAREMDKLKNKEG